MIPLMQLSYSDHSVLVDIGNKVDSAGTMLAYGHAWRELCGAIEAEEPALLDQPIETRVTPKSLKMLANYTNDASLPSMLSGIQSCVRILFGKKDAYRLVSEAAAKAREASGVNERRRQAFAARRDGAVPAKTPNELYDEAARELVHEILAKKPISEGSAKRVQSDWIQFLRANGRPIDWNLMPGEFLVTQGNLVRLEAAWPHKEEPWRNAARMNAFAFAVKHICSLTVSATVLKRAAELRALNPDGLKGEVKRSIAWKKVPEEDRLRLDFAFRDEDDEDELFIYNGRSLQIPRSEIGEETQAEMRYALRHFHSALAAEGSKCASQLLEEWGCEAAFDAVEQYFHDSLPQSRASRVGKIKSALSIIMPERDWSNVDDRIRRLGAQAEVLAKVEAPPLSSEHIFQTALVALESLYVKLIDLRSCKFPYWHPKLVAVAFRNALVVAMLADVALRLRTMRKLNEKHVVHADEDFSLSIEAALMKMKVDFYQDLSPRLTIHIQRWLTEVRRIFEPEKNVLAFLISDEGRPLSRSELQRSVKAMSLLLVGHALSIQSFRRMDATSRIGEEVPDDQYELNNGLAHDNERSAAPYQDHDVLANAPRDTILTSDGDDILIEPQGRKYRP